MALKDLIPPTPTPAAERPPAITCEKFQGRHDFGSSRVMVEMKALLWAKVEGRVA